MPASALGTLAHHGPLARTVGDAALMLTIIAAPDARDVYGWIDRAPDYRAGLEDGVAGLKIAVSPKLGWVAHVDADVAERVAAAAKVCESLGAHVDMADPDIGADAIAAWNAMWWPGMAYQLAAFEGRPAAGSDPGLVAGAELGGKIPATQLIAASLKRAELHNRMARFHASYDLLLTPTLPLPAFEVGHLLPPAGGWGAMDRLGALQLSQQPAASLPCGVTQRGLPVGLQLVGAIGRDGARASRACEAVAPFLMLEAPRQY